MFELSGVGSLTIGVAVHKVYHSHRSCQLVTPWVVVVFFSLSEPTLSTARVRRLVGGFRRWIADLLRVRPALLNEGSRSKRPYSPSCAKDVSVQMTFSGR